MQQKGEDAALHFLVNRLPRGGRVCVCKVGHKVKGPLAPLERWHVWVSRDYRLMRPDAMVRTEDAFVTAFEALPTNQIKHKVVPIITQHI